MGRHWQLSGSEAGSRLPLKRESPRLPEASAMAIAAGETGIDIKERHPDAKR